MPHPLEAGTIRILKPDGSTAGTGFLVSKRLAVTCAHVVESATAKPKEIVKFKYHLGDLDVQDAKILENGWSIENDVAILELTEKPPKWIRPIIMQSSRAMEGRSFQGLGYPDDGSVQERWPQGNISGRVDVEGYANPLLQIQGKEIDRGLSGSALVDRTTRRVIGIISAYQDIARQSSAEQARFGYAIPIETIWKVYPELEKELPPLLERSPLVEGIHLLPNGYDFRIQNFLSEYLGTLDQPEPFGGREDALKTLDNWLDGDTQRLLLAAPAGRGKSALLVRWLDRLIAREDLALVFVPVSVRFRTNLASTFFASLAARLAYLHGEDVSTSMETSTDVWHELASTYLTKPLIDERKLLVVLDGLDEAGDWEATADLIPAELPNNVRVVVSARFLAGDPDVQSWLSRLGWELKGTASTLDLNPLDSAGVADVLRRMSFPLDELSRRVDIIAELYRLSGGDPLLVNLYVEDLWARGEQASRLQPEDLHSIKPGYEGYFDRWWSDQKKLWGKETPLREKSVRLVFNLLCGAMGGLTKDDLMTLESENELNTYAIEDALDALKRFVIGIPETRREKEIGYVLTHPKLRDYFWDKLAEKERTELETRFAAWGENTMKALIDEKLKPADTPHYLLQYYGAHLERAHAPVEKFLPFVDYPYWHQAWFAYEGAYGGYLQDVKRVLSSCIEIDHEEVERTGKASLLGKEIRCALIKASIHSLAGNFSPQLLVQLFRYNIWTLLQIWAYIGQIPDNHQQSKSIIELLPQLSDTQCRDILELTRRIRDEEACANALSQLARRLPEVADEALETTWRIENEYRRVKALSELLQCLPDAQLKGLLEVGRQMIYGWDKYVLYEKFNYTLEYIDDKTRIYVLRDIAQRLPEAQLKDLWEAAQQMEDEGARANVLSQLALRLPAVAGEALNAAGQIRNEKAYADVSSTVVAPLPEAAGEALEAARQIQNEKVRADVLSDLAQHLPETNLNDLLAVTLQMKDERLRVKALIALARRLPEAANKALEVIQQKRYKWSHAQALSDLVRYLPEAQLNKAIDLVWQITNREERAKVLSTLVQRFPEAASKALAAVWEISDEKSCLPLLRSLVWRFPGALLKYVQTEAQFIMSMTKSWENSAGYPEIVAKIITFILIFISLFPLLVLLTIWTIGMKLFDYDTRQYQSESFKEELANALKEKPSSSGRSAFIDLIEPLRKAPTIDSYHWFEKSHLTLASRERKDLYSDINALLPFLLHLGTKGTAREIYLAVRDITTWWP